MTEILLEKGADANVADQLRDTALLIAARSNKADELLPLLMKHGADVSVRDNHENNALHLLTETCGVKHAADLARVLIEKGCSLDDRSDYLQFQPIHLAARAENDELVKLYLDHGANVNSLSQNEESPLLLAIGKRRTAVPKTLLERGADVHHRRVRDGRTALHLACTNVHEEHIKLLLTADADVLVEDHHGKTPFALVNRHIEIFQIRPMLHALALKKLCQPSIELKDERLIEENPWLWDYYRDCIEEIEKPKVTRFFESWTFFDILTKCHCQIAGLMKNPDFEINFKNYDLTEFSMFAEDILRAFERAEKHYRSVLEQENVINEAVYAILPYLLVRRVVHYMCNRCYNVK